uniref:Si:ch73-132f6.5 n=1 Tax=Sinocyclocheilus rhinocerous TaxID=307959 RepID=A0A673HHC7_9TELE
MTNLARISGSLHRLTVRVCSASQLPFCRNNALYSHSFSESATTVRCFTRDSRYRSSNRHYASSAHNTVRIGCASGFWGDTATSDSLTELRMPDSEGKKPLPKTVHSMNAYLGTLPIKRCLDLGADIVVTGHCVDSAVVLGPLMHSVRLGGHLIECDVDGGAVKVDGAKGSPPSADYKVCATYMDGLRATAVCPVGGPRAAEKARRTAESIIKRTQRIFKQLGLEDYAEVNIQVLGAEDTYGPHAVDTSPREAVVWMTVHHKQKKALELFSREVAPAGTGMGEQKPQSPVLKPFFFLHPKADLEVHIHVNGELVETHREAALEPSLAEGHYPSLRSEENSPTPTDLPSGPHTFRLDELAYTRSGDKGDSSNIGVIARHPLYFPYLKKCLTAEVVEQYFQHLIRKDQTDLPSVIRYELPGIHGLNFILPNSLGGGGVASLRSDPQGKAYGQMLLDYKLRGLPDLKSLVD